MAATDSLEPCVDGSGSSGSSGDEDRAEIERLLAEVSELEVGLRAQGADLRRARRRCERAFWRLYALWGVAQLARATHAAARARTDAAWTGPEVLLVAYLGAIL